MSWSESVTMTLRLAQHNSTETPGIVMNQGPNRGVFTPELDLVTLSHGAF